MKRVSFWSCFIQHIMCKHAKSLQLCLSLCNPMDWSLLGSSVHGILQARILEWVAMPSSRGPSSSRDPHHLSYVSCICRPFSLRPPGKPIPVHISPLFRISFPFRSSQSNQWNSLYHTVAWRMGVFKCEEESRNRKDYPPEWASQVALLLLLLSRFSRVRLCVTP